MALTLTSSLRRSRLNEVLLTSQGFRPTLARSCLSRQFPSARFKIQARISPETICSSKSQKSASNDWSAC